MLEKKLAGLTTGRKTPKKRTPFSDAGTIAGRGIGSMFGRGNMGAGIGKWLGSGIGSIFGSGDYTLSGPQPSYNVLTSSTQIPKFASSQQTNVVCHREYLQDIQGTAGFNNSSFPLNPGMSTTFPWLSTIAQNYQEYRIHGLIFEFRPLITDFITGGAPGVVVMATNYNADAPMFTSKVAMENSEYAVAVKPTNGLIHGIECAVPVTTIPQRYVRTGSVPTGQDLRLYDYGNFQFATQNNPVQNLGELWVSYCVEFFKPVLPDEIGGNVLAGHYSGTTVSPTNPLGLIQNYNLGDLVITRFSGSIFTFLGQPQQKYSVAITWIGSSTASVVPANVSLVIGGNTLQYYGNQVSAGIIAPSAGSTTTTASLNFMLQCTLLSPGSMAVTLQSTGVYPTASIVDVVITELSASISQ